MTKRKRKYWASRVDKANSEQFWVELTRGYLRQGWGYDEKQDLRLVREALSDAGQDWKQLPAIQQEVKRHYPMLGDSHDHVRPRDIVLVPNVPRQGYFALVEVVGEYAFAQVDLATEGWSGHGRDFGHRLEIRLITKDPIPVFSRPVSAKIRTTLRTPSRFWNLDWYAEELDGLVDLAERGKVGEPESGAEKLLRVKQQWKAKLGEAGQDLLAHITREFRGEELEPIIVEALESLYPGAVVQHVGGVNEHGADVLLQIPNHFEPSGENGWLVLVQVKNWEGHAELSGAIEKLIEGCGYWKEQLQQTVIAAVVVTTADSADEEVKEEWRRLGGPEAISFSVATKQDVAALLADGFRLIRSYE